MAIQCGNKQGDGQRQDTYSPQNYSGNLEYTEQPRGNLVASS